jgi:DNA-binding protein HU-beta
MLNQKELLKAISDRADVTQATVKDVINALSAIVREQLQCGDSVTLHRSLGSFNVKEVAERKWRNPKSGEELTIKAHRKPSFKVSTSLKYALK